jgi:type II secretory pathway pseudopilin PulG
MNKRVRKNGFTLYELTVIIMVLSILAAVVIEKYANMRTAAVDTAARGMLASLRTANDLAYGRRLIRNESGAYTMGDAVALLDHLRIEHINYSNQGMKAHVRLRGQEYWYTMSSPGPGFPSISEWKHDQW